MLIYAQHAVDIEATIQHGALDVGIFAPEDMLDLQQGEEMMKKFKLILDGLVSD